MDSGIQAAPGRILRGASSSLVEARVLVHSFDLEPFLAAANAGIEVADSGVAAGRRAVAELRLGRTGPGHSVVVILAVIVAPALKVRAIEKEASP